MFKLRIPIIALGGWILAGCATTPPRNPVPAELTGAAQPVGFEDVRIVMNPFSADWQGLDDSLKGAEVRAADKPEPLELLALSGGGANGAWGAGVVCGWTHAGNRPDFDIVTGVSTGALSAPYAFLGPRYDEELKQSFTTISDDEVFRIRNIFSILQRADSIADPTPLLEGLRERFDETFLAEVAKEHSAGRRLYVGTTDLDAQILVAWDMGSIATSGHPQANELFCQVLLASASVPAAFPPVTFDVEADGRRFDEMHADGGLMSQVFGFSALYRLMVASGRTDARMFVLRNTIMSPQWQVMKPSLITLAARSIGTLTKTQGIGDVYRAWAVAREAGIEFFVSDIPASVLPEESNGQFDPIYMTQMYEAGFERATNGQIWTNDPPLLDLVRDISETLKSDQSTGGMTPASF
jgi:hypothetical protein